MSETQPRSPGAVCAAWWRRTFGADDGAARMVRARLRRCATPAEALAIEAVHDLNAQLRATGYRPGADRLALVAIVLAHVTENGNRRLAEVFGRRESRDGPPALSGLRFQTLVQTTDPAGLIAPLRRAMAIVRATPVHVAALAADLYRWNENVRNGWCFQYYGASDAAPAQSETDLEEIEA